MEYLVANSVQMSNLQINLKINNPLKGTCHSLPVFLSFSLRVENKDTSAVIDEFM